MAAEEREVILEEIGRFCRRASELGQLRILLNPSHVKRQVRTNWAEPSALVLAISLGPTELVPAPQRRLSRPQPVLRAMSPHDYRGGSVPDDRVKVRDLLL
jgi:hypothetical protein